MRAAKPCVDYDELAATYDRRFMEPGPSGRKEALRGLASTVQAERVLEVGCGTGHWLASLRALSHLLYGLDRSVGMLQQARARLCQLNLIRGYACCLPFRAGAFQLVTCVNALHHFANPQGFVGEAFRVLGRRGALAVVGSDPHSRRDRWYVYDYFVGTYETDLRRFPPWDQVRDWMVAAGFVGLECRVVESIFDSKKGRQVLQDPYLRKDACSQLALLDQETYATGLREIEGALAAAELRGETILFETDLTILMLHGRKPSGQPAGQ